MISHLSCGWRLVVLFMCGALGVPAQQPRATHTGVDYLANNTVLVVRHAEKPLIGPELTPAGQARAQAYVHYFEPFREDHLNFAVDALFAGADSTSSVRPRQTLEPLSKASGLPLDTSISTEAPEELVALLRTRPHGSHPLIAWRHGQIPALLTAFGAQPTLLPETKWPDDIFDWVVILQFNSAGKLQSAHLVKEHLVVQPADGSSEDGSSAPSTRGIQSPAQ